MVSDLRGDFERYRAIDRKSPAPLIWLRHQGLWALSEHRFAHWVRSSPRARWLLPVSHLWHMLIEITTGISIGPRAEIGKGCYIGHFGGIVVSNDAKLGPGCTFSQGVTIGIGGHGDDRGSPVIGTGVYIGPGAKVFGNIVVGDHASIGANAVVNRDVPAGSLVGGVPARIIRE